MKTKITLLLCLILAAGTGVKAQVVLNQAKKVVVEENSGRFTVTVDGKAIATDLKSADSDDDMTVIVENRKGFKGVIDYTGKLILPYKYKDVINSSPTVFVVTDPAGETFILRRDDLASIDAIEVDVYAETVKRLERESGVTHVDNVIASGEEILKRKRVEWQEYQDEVKQRLTEIGFGRGTISAVTVQGYDEPGFVLNVRGKQIKSYGEATTLLTTDPLDRYWFIVVGYTYKNKEGKVRLAYRIEYIDTETGISKVLVPELQLYGFSQAAVRGYDFENTFISVSYLINVIKADSQIYSFDGKNEMSFQKVADNRYDFQTNKYNNFEIKLQDRIAFERADKRRKAIKEAEDKAIVQARIKETGFNLAESSKEGFYVITIRGVKSIEAEHIKSAIESVRDRYWFFIVGNKNGGESLEYTIVAVDTKTGTPKTMTDRTFTQIEQMEGAVNGEIKKINKFKCSYNTPWSGRSIYVFDGKKELVFKNASPY